MDESPKDRYSSHPEDFNHLNVARGAKAVLDAGSHVQLGAHGQLQGLGTR